MKGLVGAWNTHLVRVSLGLPPVPGAGVADLETFIVELATTAIRHFFVQVNGNWQTWQLVAWSNGSPVSQATISVPTDTAVHTNGRITVGNTWWDWHFG